MTGQRIDPLMYQHAKLIGNRFAQHSQCGSTCSSQLNIDPSNSVENQKTSETVDESEQSRIYLEPVHDNWAKLYLYFGDNIDHNVFLSQHRHIRAHLDLAFLINTQQWINLEKNRHNYGTSIEQNGTNTNTNQFSMAENYGQEWTSPAVETKLVNDNSAIQNNFTDSRSDTSDRNDSSRKNPVKEKFYKCRFCNASYKFRYTLINHHRAVHKEYPIYHNMFSDKTYVNEYTHLGHLKRIHRINASVNFKYDSCNEFFHPKLAFQKHQFWNSSVQRPMHLLEKGFKCSECAAFFRKNINRLYHEWMQHGKGMNRGAWSDRK